MADFSGLQTIDKTINNGAVEKTRTSTGVTPQRPQRCASTNSATTALGPWDSKYPVAKQAAKQVIKRVCLDAVSVNMDAAFVLIGTGPAAGAIVAALFHARGTRHAPD